MLSEDQINRSATDESTSNLVMEFVAPSIFLLVLVLILLQCNLCFGKDSRDLLDKPVDVKQTNADGTGDLVDQAADHLGRVTNVA